MYILPSNTPDTAVVVSHGKPVTSAVKRYLNKIGKQFYFLVSYEYEQPEDRYSVAN